LTSVRVKQPQLTQKSVAISWHKNHTYTAIHAYMLSITHTHTHAHTHIHTHTHTHTHTHAHIQAHAHTDAHILYIIGTLLRLLVCALGS